MIHLIVGGARSGKSRLAEQCATASGLPVTYIATASAGDQEMAARIEHHQARRPANWGLIEEPLDLAGAISAVNGPHCLLVDCLTLWLTNWLMVKDESGFNQAKQALLSQLAQLAERNQTQQEQQSIILVSNETGMGVIPLGEITRRYVDESGRLHQAISDIADHVTLTIAGLPLPLKQQGKPCFNASHLPPPFNQG